MVRGEVEWKCVEGWRRYFWRRYFGEDIFGGEDILEKIFLEEIFLVEKIFWRRYFLGRKNKNNESGGFPGLSRECGNLSGKYRNRPKFKYLGPTRKIYQKSIILY